MNKLNKLLSFFLILAGVIALATTGCESGGGGGKSDDNSGAAAPTVTSISPTSGVNTGGTTVTISGTNFSTGATVQIGDFADNVVVVSSIEITAITRAGSGTVNVVVTNTDGQSGTLASGYTYTTVPSDAPRVDAVSPNFGSASGAEPITITGANFTPTLTVVFAPTGGGTNLEFAGTSDDGVTINVSTPTATAGAIYFVQVRNADGQISPVVQSVIFTYTSSQRWLRTQLNSPNTGRALIWNPNMRPLYPRGGHMAVWTGQTGDTETADRMIVWGRNTSRIWRDRGPIFDANQPFWQGAALPDLTLVNPEDTVFLKGSPYGYFDPSVSIKFGTISATVVKATAGWVEVIVPAHGGSAPLIVKATATNPDGQYDITTKRLRIAPSRQKISIARARENEFGSGGFNIGAYYQITGPASYEGKWTEINLKNAPSPRNGFSLIWNGKVAILWGGYDDRGQPNFLNDGYIYNPKTDEWTAISGGGPSPRTGHVALWTSERMLIWGGNDLDKAYNDGGLYNPATDTWWPIDGQVFESRTHASSVLWTGTKSLVWGGLDAPLVPGALSEPLTLNNGATFEVLILPNEEKLNINSFGGTNRPAARYDHSAVWTGRHMVIWGGMLDSSPDTSPDVTNTGAAYDPETNGWTTLTTTNAPSARYQHTAVYLRSSIFPGQGQMVVWGGIDASDDGSPVDDVPQPNRLANGATLDTSNVNPALWTWTALPLSIPEMSVLRYQHSASVALSDTPDATPDQMIVWGGDGNREGGTGFIYKPTGTTPASFIATFQGNSPPRGYHTAVVRTDASPDFTMIVCGGRDLSIDNIRYNTGAIFTPPASATGQPNTGVGNWTKTATMPVDPFTPNGARSQHTAVWASYNSGADNRMIIWGGNAQNLVLKTGGIYDPVGNSWTTIDANLADSPTERDRHTAVWADTLNPPVMIVWGGATIGGAPLASGGRYEPSTNDWTPTKTANGPAARFDHTAVWIGNRHEMLIWGGQIGNGNGVGSGARYDASDDIDASDDKWAPIGIDANTPTARYAHSAVWTQGLTTPVMIVWGGQNNGVLFNDGALYNPATNTWIGKVSTGNNCPSARARHTAIWATSIARMIVWGGDGADGPLNDGGVYDPITNTWEKITTSNAPLARFGHTAVWIDSYREMIVFGGFYDDFLASGGIYFPLLGRWELFGQH